MIILDTQIKNTYVSQAGIKINNIQYIKNGEVIYNWYFVDKIINDTTYSFIREIGKSTIHYENNTLTLVIIIKKTKAISKSKVSKSLINRFITMDLETILINNVLLP